MIIVIRISGLVEVPESIQKTLFNIKLRRKFSAVLLKETEENFSLLHKIKDFVAYGIISKEDLILLLEKRGKFIKKQNSDAKQIAENIEKKSLEEQGVKPFFRLHSPRGNIDSKIHFPVKKGVLGNHGAKISFLLRRML